MRFWILRAYHCGRAGVGHFACFYPCFVEVLDSDVAQISFSLRLAPGAAVAEAADAGSGAAAAAVARWPSQQGTPSQPHQVHIDRRHQNHQIRHRKNHQWTGPHGSSSMELRD